MRSHKYVAAFLLFTIVLSCAATARAADDDWRFSLTPYIWVPSVNSKQAINDEPIEVQSETESYDILSKIDFVLLLCGDAAKNRFGIVYDFQYLKLSDEGSQAIGPQSFDFNTGLTIADATLALEYRVIDDAKSPLDAFVGGRAFYVKSKIKFDATQIFPEFGGEQSKSWLDPIIGVKGAYRFNDKWALQAYGDIGGFGVSSKITYQLLGTVRYNFNERCALQAGYRFFADDFESGDFKLNIKLYGPVVGLTFTF